ncbi:S-adenosyl-L-methionine-dependent methyltransferase [Lipomyces tetrasporus]|uniref:tRNA (guanine(10)-N(2))-methyltransferase n=1 Tax=Lipomyces tetrasporus TaxID=54092 RepID=A0AAD7VSW8_9ASCO|nr:S-adenosyl-L-methionine-dependent methyltransferase [Lipomyces tetrasporus]KAJ8101557.1 S-adenosyl-L-methionine-dependent methyltransferase [Lipomyces tetrasporus]
MPEYLILLAQKHESFRKTELEALAELEQVPVDLSGHDVNTPLLYVTLDSEEDARRLIRRSILVRSIFEVWGRGNPLERLHEDVKRRTSHLWPRYKDVSFKFDVISYRGSRTKEEQREIIESFSFLDFEGPIRMRNPEEVFTIIEEYNAASVPINDPRVLKDICFGRFIRDGQRDIIDKYDLKKRKYIGTTSFDAELALISSNIGLAAPGKLVYDPFAGTGSFLVAASHFGAMAFGSDIDGRQIRGTPNSNIVTNYNQYNVKSQFLDTFVCDFTHNPIRPSFRLDVIICDPPYGVREGLKVLGSRNTERYADRLPTRLENGDLSHLQLDYIPPKKPYHFDALLDDLLFFAADHLVDNGRLCCWMPTANEDYGERDIPMHPNLKLISNCVQEFNKWSRRLLTYSRRPRDCPSLDPIAKSNRAYKEQFRDKYFRGFSRPKGDVAFDDWEEKSL